MRVLGDREEQGRGDEMLPFVIGAAGGLLLGLVLSGRTGQIGTSIGERARDVARRLRPARLRRQAAEQAELAVLEDAVLDALTADEILSERGIDVGAISRGIVELGGSVESEDEAGRAVQIARRVPGVETVVSRLDIEGGRRYRVGARARSEAPGTSYAEAHWTGNMTGMGSRRQGEQTEPDRPDDSHPRRERALRDADLDQYEDDLGVHEQPRVGARPGPGTAENPTNFSEDELDNQDPHGRHAPVTLDEQPQALNTSARVGETPKPGIQLAIERAGLANKTDQDTDSGS